jgi:hypothetical protein
MVIRVALLLFCLLALPFPSMISVGSAGNAAWAYSGACGPPPCAPPSCPPPDCGPSLLSPGLCGGIIGACTSICGAIIGCPSAIMRCILAPPPPPRPRCGPAMCPPPPCAPPMCGSAPAPCWPAPAPCAPRQITKCKPYASAPSRAASPYWYAQPGPVPMVMYPPPGYYPAGPMPAMQGGLPDILSNFLEIPFKMVSGSLNGPGMPGSLGLYAGGSGSSPATTFGSYW